MSEEKKLSVEQAEYTCSDCGVDVKESDKVCPKCGADLSNEVVDNSFSNSKGRLPMSQSEILFSFSGRISVREYWLKGALFLLPFGIINNILAFGVATEGARAFSMIIGIFFLWPSLALLIKRWHDRDRSAWWFLTLLVPFLGFGFGIWIIIEVWFLKGTDGENRFGLDPLGNIDISQQ